MELSLFPKIEIYLFGYVVRDMSLNKVTCVPRIIFLCYCFHHHEKVLIFEWFDQFISDLSISMVDVIHFSTILIKDSLT